MSMIWGEFPLPLKGKSRSAQRIGWGSVPVTDPSPARRAGPPLSGEGEEALGRGDLPVAGTRYRALAQTAAGRKAGQAMEHLIPGAQRKTEGPRHAVPADRELAHGLGNLPDAMGPCGKEGHIARPQAVDFAVLVGDQHLAGTNVHGFVDRIMPFEAAGRAGPGHDRGGPIGTLGEPFGARLRIALDDPAGIDRIRREFNVGGSRESDGGRGHDATPTMFLRFKADARRAGSPGGD